MPKPIDQLYHSFLVRCWCNPESSADGSTAWRFELQEVSDEAQKYRFSDLEQLKAFVAVKLNAVAAGNQNDER